VPEKRFSEAHLEQYTLAVSHRLEKIKERIVRSGGDVDLVTIVAVTKTFGLDAVIAAHRAGIVDIGENYADELVEKATALNLAVPDHRVRWHFLGGIQRNKINRLSGLVGLYEGLDRYEEGEAIARRVPGASVLVEVDTARISGRGGVVVEAVPELVRRLEGLGLLVEGLMTVAPPCGGESAVAAFRSVTTLRAELGLGVASMGMSEDLEFAVAEGSTMIRVGRALFGPRP